MGAKPAECFVVEDTPSGVTAASSAGMCGMGYAADSDEQALRGAGVGEILRCLDELPRLLCLD
jgi:beta-phosphoglucomutase-like phosphatase (HAD superfamily)